MPRARRSAITRYRAACLAKAHLGVARRTMASRATISAMRNTNSPKARMALLDA